MARLRAILAALVTALRRDLRTFGSFSGNNLFVVGLAFLFLGDPRAFATLSVFIALMLFIPLSGDPLRVLPRDRLNTWPLSTAERRILRVLTPWLNPVSWFVAGLVFWRRISWSVCALAAAMFAIGFALPSLPARKGLWRRVPSLPGSLNHLIRKNLRETLSTLDFWGAAVVSATCLGFRAAGALPSEALLPMTIVVILAVSTYSQTLFGLDGDEGMTRYHLLPVFGWQILAAKDLVFLALAALLTLPLAPAAGIAAALSALAIGHHASVLHRGSRVRWRFSNGISFGTSILQVVVTCAAAAAVHAQPAALLPCAGIYTFSTIWYGRKLERQPL